MKLLSLIVSSEAFRFQGTLGNKLPGVYVMVDLQRSIQRAMQRGEEYIPNPNHMPFQLCRDQTQIWVDVVGTVAQAL